jgi:Cdc6-like AAA superfamily ATPase
MMIKDKEERLDELLKEVNFRQSQIKLLYDLLMSGDTFSYPFFHLYGLSGTGKTFITRKFFNKFCANIGRDGKERSSSSSNYYIYLNCTETSHAPVNLLFNEILTRFKNIFKKKFNLKVNDDCDVINSTTETNTINDCSSFIRQFKRIMNSFTKQIETNCNFYLIFDNADSLKYLTDSANFLLTMSKLNEYLNVGINYNDNDDDGNKRTSQVCCLFISEIDWHSLISQCDLMSKTECSRPYPIHFNDYTKDEMCSILQTTAKHLINVQHRVNFSFNFIFF